MTPVTADPAAVEGPMPFSGTGKGLKIAVIDSGVNAKHPHIHAVTKGVVFGSGEPEASSEDVLGHGTAVMAAIQEKAPAAEYYALRLFSNSLRTTTARLLEAIDWAISNRMDIVNLSLGTPKLEYREELEELVERAAEAGTLIVAARQAGDQPVLPGMLPEVISVGVDWEIPRHQYYPGDGTGPSFFASGYPRPLPGMPVRRNLHGISFAVANLSGIIARAIEELPDRSFDTVSKLLIANSRS